MRKWRYIFMALALFGLLIASCAGNTGKSEMETVEQADCSSSDYNAVAGPYLEDWEEIIKITLTRFPGALEPSINDLTKMLGEFKNLELADCYQPAHEKNIEGMGLDLDGVKEFNSTGNVSDQHQRADEAYAAALDELKKLDE